MAQQGIAGVWNEIRHFVFPISTFLVVSFSQRKTPFLH